MRPMVPMGQLRFDERRPQEKCGECWMACKLVQIYAALVLAGVLRGGCFVESTDAVPVRAQECARHTERFMETVERIISRIALTLMFTGLLLSLTISGRGSDPATRGSAEQNSARKLIEAESCR